MFHVQVWWYMYYYFMYRCGGTCSIIWCTGVVVHVLLFHVQVVHVVLFHVQVWWYMYYYFMYRCGGTCVTNLGWFGQFHTKSSVWLHGQLLLLKSLVRSLPATLYTFYTILNMLSEWFKPTRSGSMVLSGHGKWLCSYIPRQLGSRTLVAGLWSGRVRGRTRS